MITKISTALAKAFVCGRTNAAVVLLTLPFLPGCQLPLRSEEALKLPTTSSEARTVQEAHSSTAELRDSQRLDEVILLLDSSKLQDAQQSLVSILQTDPNHSVAVESLAEVSQRLGDYRLQQASLKRLIALQMKSATIVNRAGKQLLNSIQMEATMLDTGSDTPSNRDLSSSPQTIFPASETNSTIDADDKDGEAIAIAALSRAVELEPRNTLFAQDLFAALIGLGRNEQAEEVLQQSLKRNPCDRILPMSAARLYESKGDWSTAVFYYDIALLNDPENPVWRRHRAVCHFRQGAYEKARVDFSKSLSGSPVKPQLSEHLAWAEAALEMDNHQEAQRVLDLIVTEGEYRTADIEVLRGTCQLKQGQVQAAAGIVLQAQLNWPRHAGLWRLAKEIKSIE
ncbi:MAG: tetratricopeptide repeat protein [Planctomycetota bacterium]|nr:tetratricopeptide repeat protein [Planctomycetota bacterium]